MKGRIAYILFAAMFGMTSVVAKAQQPNSAANQSAAPSDSSVQTIGGRVLDGATGKPVERATVRAWSRGMSSRTAARTNKDGYYLIIVNEPMKFDSLTAQEAGFGKAIIRDTIRVRRNDRLTMPTLKLTVSFLAVEVEYRPVVDVYNVSSGSTTSGEAARKTAAKNTNQIVRSTAGVTQVGNGGLTIKGARVNGTQYIVDGIRVGSYSPSLPYPANPGPNLTAKPQPKPTINTAERIGTETFRQTAENPFVSSTGQPLSTFGIDVDNASYSNIRRYLEQSRQLPPPDAVRTEEMINYFRYSYPEPDGNTPFSLTTSTAVCPWNTGHRLLMVGLKGKDVDISTAPPANLVFLIDVSGSMSGSLPLVKESLGMLVQRLRKEDKVSIVVYAGAAGTVLPPTSGDKKDVIIKAINRLESGGSTAGGEGIMLAYKLAKDHYIEKGNNRVILATDGDFNVGINNVAELEKLIEKKREEGVFLSALGFGSGNYRDDVMETLADKGNGNYVYIDGMKEAKKALSEQLAGTLLTIAKDVKLQLQWNPAQVKGYRLIGYENRMLAAEDFANDKKDAGDMGAGHTVTALYEIIPFGSQDSVPGFTVPEYKGGVNPMADTLVSIRMRYKAPDADKSKLLVQGLRAAQAPEFATADENLRWAASVSAWAMLLRNSPYKAECTYEKILEWARNAVGKDAEGYRAECIRLIESSAGLAATVSKK